jgi:hypothetical protein
VIHYTHNVGDNLPCSKLQTLRPNNIWRRDLNLFPQSFKFCIIIRYTYTLVFIFQRFFQPIQGPGLLFGYIITFTETVGLLGRVISQSQGRYLHTGQHKHRINAYIHQTPMPWVGFEPTIPTSERAKTVHALDHAATETSTHSHTRTRM